MEFVPIKSKSLVEEVAGQLAKFVLALQPGEPDHLPAERKLAEKFGVARGVVREAIKRLEIQGFLEVRQGSGIRAVKQLHKSLNASLEFLLPDTKERLLQATQTRIIIEPAVAAAAANSATPDDIIRLKEIHSELEGAEDVDSSTAADIAFHQALAAIARNEVLKLVLDSMSDLRRESAMRTHGKVGKEVALAHHQSILEAIEAKDSEGAKAAMHKHLVAAMEDLGMKTNGYGKVTP